MIKGLNVDPWHGFLAKDVAKANIDYVRTVEHEDRSMMPWIVECEKQGISVLAVITGESGLYNDETAQRCQARYGNRVVYQIGNEWNLDGPSSDKRDPQEINTLAKAFRHRIPDAKLVLGAPGSGLASDLDKVDLGLFDAVAEHTYTKSVNGFPSEWRRGHSTGEVYDLVMQFYEKSKKPVWVTEYGAKPEEFDDSSQFRTSHRTQYYIKQHQVLRETGVVEAAFAFCYSNKMVYGYGIQGFRSLFYQWRKLEKQGDMITVGAGIQAEMTKRNDYAIKNPVFYSNNDNSTTEHVVGTKGEYWASNTTGSWVVTFVPFA